MASDAGTAALTSPRDLAKANQELNAADYKGEKVVLPERLSRRPDRRPAWVPDFWNIRRA